MESATEEALAPGALDEQARDDQAGPQEAFADLPDVLIPVEPEAYEPDLEPELTAEQLEIKALRDQIARLSGKRDAPPEVDELNRPGDAGNIIIHFLEDGFSALGRVFYRGEELEFEAGSQAYKDTFNKFGKSWLSLRHNEFEQVDRFGKIMFRNGPWPGKNYSDGTFETLRTEKGDGMVPAPTEAEIEAAEKARKRRAAPKLAAINA